jgi:hypothetical protein
MPFPIRSETAARLMSGLRPEDLTSPGAVDRLMELAESDGKLSAEERTALKGALQTFQASGFDTESKARLEAFLGLKNAGVRHAMTLAASNDGVIDIADAGKVIDVMKKDGKISGTERMTVRSALLAFKVAPDAKEALERAAADVGGTGAFADIHLKDRALRNTLAGFTGTDVLGAPQVEALLKSAADGPGLSNTERHDLTLLFTDHGHRLDNAAKVLLASSLGIPFSVAGLDQVPKGTTPISMWKEDFSDKLNLDFRKTDDGMQVRINPPTMRDYGWINVTDDGTFRHQVDKPHPYDIGEGDAWTVSGKVSFANGVFTADLDVSEIHRGTRPQGANDSLNWNSGNRIPVEQRYGGVYRTESHPSLGDTKVFQGTLTRDPYSTLQVKRDVVALKTAEGLSVQFQDALMNERVRVGADGRINDGKWTGTVGADGSVSLTRTEHLSPSYTETQHWAGKINGLTLP